MSESIQQVLLIEDNPDDVFLMERAVRKSGAPWSLQIVADGQEAIDFLSGAGQFANRGKFPLPSLVFLDLKLPYVSGFEVLAWMKKESSLLEIPVAILTSSPEERDQQRALQLGAKAYLIKPPTPEVLKTIVAGQWSNLTSAPSPITRFSALRSFGGQHT